jgi:hypothetical protein
MASFSLTDLSPSILRIEFAVICKNEHACLFPRNSAHVLSVYFGYNAFFVTAHLYLYAIAVETSLHSAQQLVNFCLVHSGAEPPAQFVVDAWRGAIFVFGVVES